MRAPTHPEGAPSSLRVLVAAFGDAGHAFPAIALGKALAGRGHKVVVETWEERRGAVEGAGLGFAAAEEYRMFPPPEPDSDDGRHAAEAARALLPLLEELRPHAAVSDILTLAPALAAERAGVPLATLIPHIYPVVEPGLPFFAIGLRAPRTPLGRAGWRAGQGALRVGLEHGRRDLNQQRQRLGLPPVDRFHGGISPDLALVATYPQLEYPRRWPPGVQVTGPMTFELPHPEILLPPGDQPLVLVAPSTAHDSDNHLVRSALAALAEEPVRVVATTNRVVPQQPIEVPANAVLVDWLSYSQLMPAASLVVSHGGHGTVARALGAGTPVLISPITGDMSETAMRVDWAGCGLSLPWRLCRPAPLRWAVRRLLGDGSFAARAAEIAAWGRENDGAERGAGLVEELARRRGYSGGGGTSPGGGGSGAGAGPVGGSGGSGTAGEPEVGGGGTATDAGRGSVGGSGSSEESG
ncbi:MAG TPA: nucleotide disphospho-sugar-binding domain-containing protein [Solirubrobacterales bacterium]|nr:nucleotide disphospho-sugar-binding domain-containing protein [Solirubrobacterales bacterium]